MKLTELQRKDIIDINSGVKIGNIIDVNINDSGFITSLVVDRTGFNFGIFSSRGEMEILFDEIIKIGEDVVLVKQKNNINVK